MDEATLKPAMQTATELRLAIPGESDDYARAREALMAGEIELRRQHERLAEQRRALPPGPEITKDYRFIDENGQEVGLSELFGRHSTLLIYSWMFGPNRKRPCPMCTVFVGPLAANARDLGEHVAVLVIGASTVERQKAFAAERGWRDLKFAQPIGDGFAQDFQSLVPAPDGPGQWEVPAFAVFKKVGDTVRLFWASQLRHEFADPGQDHRGWTDVAPLWMMLDLTPGGRPAGWHAKLSYDR
jgi:predicted dithiol-disulfide oxidoreductase (DUF899 family)